MTRHVDEAREAERRPDRRCPRWGGIVAGTAWSTWDAGLAMAMIREAVRLAVAGAACRLRTERP